MLEQLRIVLVHTSHPGNIGAAARAMKTMGLSELYLVSPVLFPHEKAVDMSAGAKDVLSAAKVVATLDEAIHDCTLVVGTSTRTRAIPWPVLSPRQAAQKIREEASNGQAAILFGREQSGLTNEELHRCHVHLQIPANPDYSSLNLAAAVQVMAYELRVASLAISETEEPWDYRLATARELEKYFEHLRQVLIELDFLKSSAPRQLMTRLRRLFMRARPDVMEMNILRGMLTAVQEKVGRQ
ncbi:MAG: tRNA (cytosine(32)/uridine(32)-2'-O)-methyltransferase TrmJ [Gammaproteobacteria bacterium RIFCSPHIGHO2_12_FULL_45_12]|nr:MAG: tRNA (cytosine(32)/uridine(32)-2'-O)-methyltransferase TrmJ [Gammaproteobacteria bacterium RIFCSPHIGHO2_12_FULL_45_12]